MGMKEYVAKKLATTATTFFLVLIINFILFRIMPGDPIAALLADPRMTLARLEWFIKRYGLDKPMSEQFVLYFRELFRGNLGFSLQYQKPVLDVIAYRIPNTLILVGSAFLIATIAGVALGALAGWRRGTKTDSTIVGVSLVITWLPIFWLGTMLLIVFAYRLRLFPIFGMVTPGLHLTGIPYIKDLLRHMALPVTTMVFWWLGVYVILMRSSMMDVLETDYITTAKAKGLKESTILRGHAMRNALLPVATMAAMSLGFLVGGTIQVETVFSWPGMGRLIYDALMMRDYPLLQGTFLVTAFSVLAANFLADIMYAYIDPRVKRPGA